MIKQKWFTKDALKKFGIDIDKSYTLPSFIRPIQDYSREEGSDITFRNVVDSVQKLKFLKKNFHNNDVNHSLFLEDITVNGNTFFKVNKNFDWNWYYEKTSLENNKCSEIDLLRSIAQKLIKEFDVKDPYSVKLNKDIKNDLIKWMRMYE